MAVNIGKKQNYNNLGMNILAFVFQFFISFYISPIVVSNVGAAAYGFIGVANDFVSYASIVATVFNSVAARFIANSFYKKDFEKANRYFNSLVVANFIIAGILGLAGIVLVPNINKVLTVPASLLLDVKLTFALVFASYIITLITLVFTTSTFVTNRTDIQGVRNIILHFVRLAVIVVLLNFVAIRIYWVAAASMIATIVVAIMNVSLTKKLTPELKVDFKYAEKKYALELASAGSWMAISSISTILLRGLDLTVANIMIGDYEMGLLSIARTMPNQITAIIGTLAPVFTPVFLTYYTKNQILDVVNSVNKAMKTMALILFVPIAGFIVFSYDFYALWQKSLTQEELYIITALSICTVVQAFFNCSASTVSQLSVVTNKLKLPVFISLGCGLVSIAAELLFLKFTDAGLYAIVLSTTVVMIIRYVVFNSFYAAWCIGKPLTIFLPTAIKTWLSIPGVVGIMLGVRKILPIHSWGGLLVDAMICSVLGYIIMFLLYGRDELSGIRKKSLKK